MHVIDHFDADKIRALRDSGDFFWLDLEAPTDEQIDLLAEWFDLPPLAVEDSHELNQRPKIDDYGDRLLIVFYGVAGGPDRPWLIELHMHLAPGRVITLHRQPCPPLEPVKTMHVHTDHEIVYRILDSLSESVLTLLRKIEAEVTGVEQRAFERPSEAERRRAVELRGRLFRLLQVIVPQRDMLGTGAAAIERVLGMETGMAHHPFQDIRDDLVQAINLIAYCRELLAEALNVYLQATSNRLNTVATRLSLLATIFVPLTIITGFFGQNFGWLVDHIDSLTAFLIWGIGGTVGTVLVIGVWLWRAGYLNSNGQ